MDLLKSNDYKLTRSLWLLSVPPESDLDTGFHYLGDKLRKHQQVSRKGSRKKRHLIKGMLASQATAGQLDLNLGETQIMP